MWMGHGFWDVDVLIGFHFILGVCSSLPILIYSYIALGFPSWLRQCGEMALYDVRHTALVGSIFCRALEVMEIDDGWR